MARTVSLRGYPEAILATDSITLSLRHQAPAGAIVQNLADLFPQLRTALMLDDGMPRRAVRVLVDGVPVSHESAVPASGALTLVATLPCDG